MFLMFIVFVERAFQVGAIGYMTKSTDPEMLSKAISQVAQGKKYLDDELKQKMTYEYEKLRDDFNMNEMIKQASLQFKPLVGEPYYLYERIKEFRGSSVGSTFLSLISPTEYGASYMESLKFLGCYKVDSHEVWRESRD